MAGLGILRTSFLQIISINDLSNESILLDEVSNEPAAFHLLYPRANRPPKNITNGRPIPPGTPQGHCGRGGEFAQSAQRDDFRGGDGSRRAHIGGFACHARCVYLLQGRTYGVLCLFSFLFVLHVVSDTQTHSVVPLYVMGRNCKIKSGLSSGGYVISGLHA